LLSVESLSDKKFLMKIGFVILIGSGIGIT